MVTRLSRVAHSDMSHFTKTVSFFMAFQLKLLAFSVFLLLSLSFCHGKNVTVKLIGQIHCQDHIKCEFSSSQASLGINVFVHCETQKRETTTLGNGPVDKEGKFNITLSAQITKEGYSMESCFAKLQSHSTLPCPIQSAQIAIVKILSTENNTINRPMILKFSSVTCQSAFFLPHPKFTFFHTLPPPSEALTPHFPPAISTQSPAPAIKPLYLPPTPAPTSQRPQKPPNPPFGSQSPSPSPIYITPPPKAFHRTPFLPTPTLPPIPPPYHKEPHSETPTAPPIPVLKPPTPLAPTPSPGPSPSPYRNPPVPKAEKRIPPPPNKRKPNAIPRAPPVPQLPPIPPVPRKYFNPPNSKSQPPHS